MEKLNKSIKKEYTPVKIYLDDLRQLEELLKGNAKDFSITTEYYKFDNVEELLRKYKGSKLTKLYISTYTPYIKIEFERLWTSLYCGSDKTTEAGLYYKLDSIISSSRRKPAFLYSTYTVWIGIILTWIIGFFDIVRINYALILTIQSIAMIYISWVSFIRIRRSSEVFLVNKNSLHGFFSRNKDQLIVNFITGAIGAFLGVLGTVIVYHLKLIK